MLSFGKSFQMVCSLTLLTIGWTVPFKCVCWAYTFRPSLRFLSLGLEDGDVFDSARYTYIYR